MILPRNKYTILKLGINGIFNYSHKPPTDFSEYQPIKITQYYGYHDYDFGIYTNTKFYDGLNYTTNTKFSNVYVSKSCDIPTVDLQNNSIVRKRKIESAEVSVIPDVIINEWTHDEYDVYINKNTIILIYKDFFNNNCLFRSKQINELFEPIRQSLIENPIASLKEMNIINEDYEHIHSGKLLIIPKKYTAFLEELPYYDQVINEKDFLHIISSNREPITDDIVHSVESMLRSGNSSNIDIALNMLYTFDIRPYATKIMLIISAYSSNIRYTTFWSSSKMTALLNSINMKKDHFSEITIYNNTFEFNCDSEKDRIKELLAKRVLSSTRRALQDLNQYSFFKGYKLNNIIISHGDKDYSIAG